MKEQQSIPYSQDYDTVVHDLNKASFDNWGCRAVVIFQDTESYILLERIKNKEMTEEQRNNIDEAAREYANQVANNEVDIESLKILPRIILSQELNNAFIEGARFMNVVLSSDIESYKSNLAEAKKREEINARVLNEKRGEIAMLRYILYECAGWLGVSSAILRPTVSTQDMKHIDEILFKAEELLKQ